MALIIDTFGTKYDSGHDINIVTIIHDHDDVISMRHLLIGSLLYAPSLMRRHPHFPALPRLRPPTCVRRR